MKRILAFILAIISAFFIAACSDTTGNTPSGSEASGQNAASISIAFSTTDSFNPYTATTALNRRLTSLLYDPLIKLNSSFEPVSVLAASVLTEQKTCTVALKSAYFTDGSPVTSADVVYSFNLAKGSAYYGPRLADIESATERDGSTVIFTLKKNDMCAANLLSFPIIKIGTDKLQNEDMVFLPPIGCGRYIVNSDGSSLSANSGWHGGNVNIKSVKLVNTPDTESLTHAIEIGAIDYYYTDLSDCSIIRMSGQRVDIPQNNLVYLGINHKNDDLQSSYMRHAISAAINRSIICEQGYFNNANPANGLFHPNWGAAKGTQTIENSNNLKIAIENLAAIGYNRKDDSGIYLNAAGRQLGFTLLVNSENSFRVNAANLIAKQLTDAGIKVTVNAVSYEQYISLLTAGNFQLYLAEVNIPSNMDISAVCLPEGSAAFGLSNKNTADNSNPDNTGSQVPAEPQPITLAAMLEAFYSTGGNVPDIASAAISELPVIPICYRTGALFCSNKISINNSASADDIFFEFENININN